ncbi:MAG TPA: branched-chain amino acid ABC transporter substrate-binding protein [Geobacteraceae bacterium]|nr:branched-chain amino acid ABC transporter substrate-binding protein [Geobacteraceae bacterium]
MKRWLLLAVACCLAVACTKKESNVIKIGAAGQLTGAEAVFGADMLNGVKLAVEEWNAKGGVLGKKIELASGDDQAEPRQAVAVANKFVTEGVVGVVGHFNSSCSIPASDVYHRAGIPQISHASTNPKLTDQGFANVFRVCGRDDQQGKAAAVFALDRLKVKRVAIVHDKTTYGQGFAEEFRKGIGDKAQVVVFEGITKGEKDYTPVVTKIKAANPDVIFFGGIYTEGGLLVKQYKAVGGTAPFIGGDGIMSEEFIKIGGPATDGTYATFGPDTKEIPSAKGFNESYRKKYGEPGVYSIYAYDAANILLTAIQKAGTTDGAKVVDAIRGIDYNGALGHIRFNEKGDVKESPYVVWKVEGGKFKQVK